MRKGWELLTINGRKFRFNKKKQLELFAALVQGTPWEMQSIKLYEFKKVKEIKARARTEVDDLLEGMGL